MDWYDAVSILNIKFCHQGAPPKLHDARNYVIHLHVLEGVILASNPIVDAMTSWAGQVQDKAPFTWLIAFGDSAKVTDMETVKRRLKKGACHPTQLNFSVQVIVDDLRVGKS